MSQSGALHLSTGLQGKNIDKDQLDSTVEQFSLSLCVCVHAKQGHVWKLTHDFKNIKIMNWVFTIIVRLIR